MAGKSEKANWLHCSSLLETVASDALSPKAQKELEILRKEARMLDKETADFEIWAQRLQQETNRIVRQLEQLGKTGLPTKDADGKALARSPSLKQDYTAAELLNARERNHEDLSRLNSQQRLLFNKCMSFDNRCTALRNNAK